VNIDNRYIGCFSDIHLGLGQDDKKWHDIALEFAAWASEIYKKVMITEIIIPGDIFHNRSSISVETLSVAKQFFDYFKDFKIYISTGNHDCFKKESSDVNSIKLFDGWNNIHVIDNEPLVLNTPFNKTIGLVPWGTELKDFPKCDITFAHIEINSFYMNSYKVCEHGFSQKDLFKASPYIISGHFHKKDHRKYENGEIMYLGSPYQHNFGDAYDSRGIYIFDLKENTFKFIENKKSPKHLKFKINDQIPQDVIQNNFISLIVDENVESEKIESVKRLINTCNPNSIRVDYDYEQKNLEISTDQEFETSDLLKSIQEYIKLLDIPNKKEVEDYIKEMYNSMI
jgi:DNA repair exonuclease SbcCD nuclease subunit